MEQAAAMSPELGKTLESVQPERHALLAHIGEMFFHLGRVWEMGFQKPFPDPAPDTAFESAFLSWHKKPNLRALRLMRECLAPFHMQGEILPHLLRGLEMGLLEYPDILSTAKLTHDYYDQETAATILRAMKARKK